MSRSTGIRNLACALPDITVLTTPVVGDKAYLLTQMQMLGPMPQNLHILESPRKYHFAQPYAEFLAIWQELQEAGITVDLIYGAAMWHTLLQAGPLHGPVLYVHSGGLIGNETMLSRYRHKGFILDGQ